MPISEAIRVMKALMALLIAMLAACAPRPPVEADGRIERLRLPGGVLAEREAGILRYRGPLTEDGLDALRTLARGRETGVLEIDSAGGEIVAGMEFGLWVHDLGLDVRVNRACLSSCANYVFPAGRNKVIAPGAVVAWHGSARQTGLLEACRRRARHRPARPVRRAACR